MEEITRIVADSLARHGFSAPVDRRLEWSRWFRCESPHSLLLVPSKPGVFALAEEVMEMGASPVPQNEAIGHGAKSHDSRHMLAVTKFFEDDDMAFVLDRMMSHQNAMRSRLASGRYFIRYVVIEDSVQRRSICSALNQWIVSSAEKATGIGTHFASSLELTPEPPSVSRTHPSAFTTPRQREEGRPATVNSAVATNIHCSSSFPSGF